MYTDMTFKKEKLNKLIVNYGVSLTYGSVCWFFQLSNHHTLVNRKDGKRSIHPVPVRFGRSETVPTCRAPIAHPLRVGTGCTGE